MIDKEDVRRDLAKLKDIVAAHKAPGAPLEVGSEIINGVEQTVFTRIPDNLRGVFRIPLRVAERTFLVYLEERYSFQETFDRASRLAQVLLDRYQIKKGDRVAICSRNTPEWCMAFMAVTMTGAIAVPMNSWWTGPEMRYGIEDSGAGLLFADQDRIDRLVPECDRGLSLDIIAIKPGPDNRFPSFTDLIGALATADHERLDAIAIAPDDDALIMYTSGSTGSAKGVLSTHRNITSALYTWLFVKEIAEILRPELVDEPGLEQAILANVPLFHVTGCHAHFLASFVQPRKFVMMYKWDANKALELIEKENITVLHGVPTMTWEVMHSPRFDSTDLSSLRNVGAGGAGRPPEHVAMMVKRFPARALPGLGYGLTETNAIGATISGKFYQYNPRSTGRPSPPVTQVSIVGKNGEVRPHGEVGEICIKGASVMKRYWNKPDDTRYALKDGWFHTGDVGMLDDLGFLIIVDRAKDIVIRGGENIACAEVEYAIAEHAEVAEASVYGVPDNRLGEIPCATVMMKPGSSLTESELQEFLTGKLAHFKIPQRIFFQQDQLPRIASGKIAKKQLREQAITAMGLAPSAHKINIVKM